MTADLMRIQGFKRGRAAGIKRFEKRWARTYNQACTDMEKKEKKESAKQETTPKKEKKESPKQETPPKLIMDEAKPTHKKNSVKQETRTPKKLEMKDKAEPSPKRMKSAKKDTV